MKKTNLIAAVLIGALFSITPNAKAASYYWDTLAGAGNGVGSNPTVTAGVNAWSATGSTWSTSLAGSATLTAGTWSSSGVMGINDTAIFQVDQGTSGSGNIAGTVTVSGTSSFAINVNTTGFTFKNVSTSANNYLAATNGITLGNNVNINLSSMPVTASGTGSLGLRMSGIQAAAGATGTSITIVGDTGSTAPVAGVGGSGVRIISDKSSAVGASSTNIISVNTIIATTGTQAAYFSVNSSTSLRFEGTVTINNGSRLVLSPGTSTSRIIDVRGNIISYADGALTIGESSNIGKVFLSGNNTLTGDLNVYGLLGYGSLRAFGTTRLVLNQGASLAQVVAIGDGTDANRALNNNILLNGGAWAANTYVTIGGESQSQNLAGGVDMNGQGRLLRIDNATTFSGVISNSGGNGLVFTNNSSSTGGRTLTMAGASTYTGGTTLKTSGTGWKTVVSNTTGSAFGTGNVNFDGTGATARSLLTGTGIITGTVGGYVQATAGSASALGGGLLTVGKLDTSTASALSTMTFAFEATSTSLLTGSTYNNDVIRATATAGSPFTQALTSGNIIDVYLNAGSLAGYDNGNAGVFQTGFFSGSDFSLGTGTFNLFVQAAGGTTTFNAATYQTWAEYIAGAGAGLNQTYNINTTAATLASGDTGFISTVTIIPEPSTGAMLMFGLVGLVGMRALRRKA
ncbi:MAG: PEP-CTERM sorting domain-containing protein [Micrococcales bacterium]|nr:PEP-CTERM sorting domain-containing protein [Micrococcales bacterium]